MKRFLVLLFGLLLVASGQAAEPQTNSQTNPPYYAPPKPGVVPSGITVATPLKPNLTPADPPQQQGAAFNFSNYITNVTTRSGVRACSARMTQVTNFLVPPQKAMAGALLMTVHPERDEQLVPLLMELETDNGPTFISSSFAPHQINGCGATYDAVSYWPETCDVVAKKRFALFEPVGKLHKSVLILNGGSATKVFLMPAGTGCVSIKKEVVL